MLYLKTLYDKDIFPTKEFCAVSKWNKRKTVKIILINKKKEIALVTNPIHKCYLLPGGGINDKEDLFITADRECQEEVGFSITVKKMVGVIKEYRARDGKFYETFGVTARVLKPVFKDLRTSEERKNDLTVVWRTITETKNIFQHQDELLMSDKIEFYNTGFNIARDKIFFDTAIKRGLLI